MARKEPAAAKATSQVLIEQLMVNVGKISEVIEKEGQSIFGHANILSDEEINDYSLEFLELFVMVLHTGGKIDRRGAEFKALKEFFTNLSHQIQLRGGDMDEFVRYIQFLERVFLDNLQEDSDADFSSSRQILLLLASLFNDIVLDVFHAYLEEKERTIEAQQEELRQTSTPITEIWDGVLTLPIIGTLDSQRTMMVMEKLLSRIEQDRASVVVIDVTGVIAIDSQVSHHLIQMIRAVELMGASAVITGIRPEIARALTSLNIDLGGVTTRLTLSEGLKEAFRRMDVHVSHAGQATQ
ncbi:RsbT co-antagonist protein RsbRA [bacterium BMS3Bbin12]|nr:RsbT co-antagonist protein RsbRA [bacterium BMS3Abin12]GBE48793.1 RsbT co-antagonist protein RsbRA [bacterium BMS3Bbin12]GBE51183.1 RsbT co-antagonist protein RsbRA [bacterium BMS3Bbin13]HDJ85898.1 STAS domain-containing protein [Chromatiales bacterium]